MNKWHFMNMTPTRSLPHLFYLVLFASLGVTGLSSGDLRGATITQDPHGPITVTGSLIRSWSSRDGQYKQEARLIEILKDEIRLENKEGEKMVVVTDKLSVTDQEFVKKERLRASDANNPFQAEKKSSNPFVNYPKAPEPNTKQGQPKLDLVPNLATLRLITLQSEEQADWQAAHWQPAPEPKIKQFALPAFSPSTRIDGSFSDAANSKFLISLKDSSGVGLQNLMESEGAFLSQNKNPRGELIKNWIEIYDLVSDTSLGRYPVSDENIQFNDIDSTGKRISGVSGPTRTNPKVWIFEIQGKRLVPVMSWLADIKGRGIMKVAESVRFLSDDHVVVEYDTNVVVWSLNPLKILHSITKDRTPIKLANDQRHAMVQHVSQRYEVDLITGQCKGTLDKLGHVHLGAPHPDGQRFAQMRGTKIVIANSKGEILDEFFVPVYAFNSNVIWHDERTIQIIGTGRTYFVDIDRKAAFLDLFSPKVGGKLTSWDTKKLNEANSCSVQVEWNDKTEMDPIVELETYRDKLPKDVESILVLKEGDRVRLTINEAANPTSTAEVRKVLEAFLKSRGVIIDAAATDELIAESAFHEDEAEYRRVGIPIWDENAVERVKTKRVQRSLKLVRDGSVVFQINSSGGTSFFIAIHEGETIQQAADRQGRETSKFWSQLDIPKHVTSHPRSRPWTVLQETPAGYKVIN